MRYFFSSPTPYRKILFEAGVKNYLLSFAVDAKRINEFPPTANYIIDSGAFSLWQSGKHVDIDEYKKFCLSLKGNHVFVNLDVIPETGSGAKQIDICCQKSFENYLYLKKELKKVLPVYHYGEDIKWLKKYMEYTDYVGLSPANDTHDKVKKEYLKKCFYITRDKVKTHAFGYGTLDGMKTFPFYSVDTTTWMIGARFGEVMNFDKGKHVRARKEKTLKNPLVLSDTNARIKSCVDTFLDMERFVTKLWKKRGITWND